MQSQQVPVRLLLEPTFLAQQPRDSKLKCTTAACLTQFTLYNVFELDQALPLVPSIFRRINQYKAGVV